MSGEGMPSGIHGVPCTPNVAVSAVGSKEGLGVNETGTSVWTKYVSSTSNKKY